MTVTLFGLRAVSRQKESGSYLQTSAGGSKVRRFLRSIWWPTYRHHRAAATPASKATPFKR
jgi:hypothetical protein